jgi:16S rRNA A1518/A1519 N6-dimethyltransferase RsmA/KsgA/DIM1 with predicted DNA glycosylase/AP lyase activity
LGSLFNERQLVAAGVDPQARPETLSLEEFVGLARLLAP